MNTEHIPKIPINVKSLIDRTQFIKNMYEIEGVLEVVPLFCTTNPVLKAIYVVFVEGTKKYEALKLIENLDYVEYAEFSPKRSLLGNQGVVAEPGNAPSC